MLFLSLIYTILKRIEIGRTRKNLAYGKLAPATFGADKSKTSLVFLSMVNEKIVTKFKSAMGKNLGTSFVNIGKIAK